MSPKKLLMFGGLGSFGSHLVSGMRKGYPDWEVIVTTTRWPPPVMESSGVRVILSGDWEELEKNGPYDGVVWVQGKNVRDNVVSCPERIGEVWEANVEFVARSMSVLRRRSLVSKGANLVVLGSIWGPISKADKMSYTITKAAVSGLVRSACIDWSDNNVFVNEVCPGAMENPMTHQFLGSDQCQRLANHLGFQRMLSEEDVWRVVEFLLMKNTGITGQSITVDLGYSVTRKL